MKFQSVSVDKKQFTQLKTAFEVGAPTLRKTLEL